MVIQINTMNTGLLHGELPLLVGLLCARCVYGGDHLVEFDDDDRGRLYYLEYIFIPRKLIRLI